jgi:hypothetical protein
MISRHSLSFSLSPRLALGIGGLVVLLGTLAACTSTGQFSADVERIAYGYIPSEAEPPSHPDSLEALALVEEDNKINFELDRSYERLMRDWSTTWVSQSARRTFDSRRSYRSFATLWSLDLSLAALAAEEGVNTLSKDLAQDRIARRRQEHQQTLQIDIYRFLGSPPTGGGISSTLVGAPSSFITLRDDQGNEYRPDDVYNDPAREAVITGDRTLYRRNILYFKREVDGRDILDGVRQLRLYINDSPAGRYYFTWSFDEVLPPPSTP